MTKLDYIKNPCEYVRLQVHRGPYQNEFQYIKNFWFAMKLFFAVDSEDRIEYLFVPANKVDAPYIHKFISSQLSDLAAALSDNEKPKDQLFQVACFMRPVIQN